MYRNSKELRLSALDFNLLGADYTLQPFVMDDTFKYDTAFKYGPVFNNGDDYPSDTSTTGVVTLGGSTTGKFDFGYDSDWFEITFSGDHLIQASTSVHVSDLSLYDANGDRLKINSFTTSLVYDVTPGTYYIGVGGQWTQRDVYTLSVDEIFDDYSNDISTTGTVSVNGSVNASFDYEHDEDWFAITLAADQIINMSTTEIIEHFTVYDSSGVVVLQSNRVDSFDFITGAAGTYFIGVTGDFGQSGAYTLSVDEIIDDYAADTSTTGVVTVNGSVNGNLDFVTETERDEDWFAISLSASQVVEFTIATASSLIVYDSSGNYLAGQNIPMNALLFQATGADTYFIGVGVGVFFPQKGPYTLSVDEVNDDYAEDVSTTGSVSVGGSVTANFDFNRDEDWFAITLAANELINITTSDVIDRISMHDASGAGISSMSDTDSYNFKASTTGTYYIGAEGSFGQNGAYTLSVEQAFDDYASDISTTGMATFAGPIDARFDFGGDSDWFAISLTANQVIDIRTFQFDQGFSIFENLSIYDAAGDLVTTGPFINQLVYQADVAGQYFISITGRPNAQTNYRFTVDNIVDDYSANINTTGMVDVGGSVTGSFEYTDDVDWFEVTLGASEYYHVSVEDLLDRSGLAPEAINIYDAAGNLFTGPVFGTGYTFQSAQAGTYYIGLSAPDFQPKDYKLTLQNVEEDIAGDTSTLATISLGDRVDSFADTGSDEDWFAINLTAGEQASFGLFGLSATISIYDSSGSRIQSAFSTNILSFEASSTDIYYVGISPGGETGAYSLGAYAPTIGTANDDVINGTSGDDSIQGLFGLDTLRGGGGHDVVEGGFNADTILGNDGDDILSGGNDADLIIGGGGDDHIDGGTGNNSLSGQGGNDYIVGGQNSDTILGGSGDDFIRGNSGSDDINAGGGDDVVYAGPGFNTVRGSGGEDVIFGWEDSEQLFGNNQSDIVYGGGGDDFISGGAGNDILYGDPGNDTISGNGNQDTIYGGFGNDLMFGDSGGDHLFGGDGEDILVGGGGNDILTGGRGADLFGQSTGFRTDRITDFEDGIDLIDFSSNASASSFAAVLAKASQVNATVRIELNPNNILVIENFDLADLDASDFIF